MKANVKKSKTTGLKKMLVLILCCVGALLAAFIGFFTFLGTKAAKSRKNSKKASSPLERESLRDEF